MHICMRIIFISIDEEHEQVKDFFIATGSPSRDNGFGAMKQQHPEKNISGLLLAKSSLSSYFSILIATCIDGFRC